MNRIAFLLAAALPAFAAPQDLGDIEQRADEVAIVTVNADTLRAIARICEQEGGEDAQLVKALTGISEIKVRALSFHDGKMPSEDDIARVRAAGIPAGWPRFLSSRSTDPEEMVEGYLGPEGMALLTWEPGEITTVSIRGKLSAKDAPALGGHFGVPPIQQGLVIQSPEPAPSAAVAPARGPKPEKLNFGQMVRDIEARQGIHHTHIPLFGLAKPVAFMASGGSVRALDMAIFDEAPPAFAAAVGQSVPRGWSPLVEVREGDETTNIWLGEVGRSMRVLLATQDASEAMLLTTKLSIADLDKNPFEWGRHKKND